MLCIDLIDYSIYSDEDGIIKFAKMYAGCVIDEVRIPAYCIIEVLNDGPYKIGYVDYYDRIHCNLSEYEKGCEFCCFYPDDWGFNEVKRIISKGKKLKMVGRV